MTRINNKIFKLYDSGMSITKMSKKIKISRPTISKRLKAMGVIIRPQAPPLDKNLIKSMYESGLSSGEIASKFGVSDTTIFKKLDATGTPRRHIKGQTSPLYRGGPRHHKETISLANQAIRKGLLTRPKKCESCGTSPRTGIQAHHDDYNKPLEVRWFCIKCHKKWHRENVAVKYIGDTK